MRPLIRYDLDDPPTAPSVLPAPPYANARRPSARKRKRNHHIPQKRPSTPHIQHWDDPGSATVGVVYDEQEGNGSTPALFASGSVTMTDAHQLEEEEYGEAAEGEEAPDAEPEEEEEEEEEGEEESRPLTHREIWDDSALIDAWNSAEAEYKAYHGTSKSWKTELVKNSPLWYNKPHILPVPQPQPRPSKPQPSVKHNPPPLPQHRGDGEPEPEPDTALFDFDNYVPTHDPSLGISSNSKAAIPATNASFSVPLPSMTMISRDEAFNNALSAMYWGGYWTAVYHCQSQSSGKDNSVQVEATGGNEIEVDSDSDEEDLVPAQR